MGAIMRRRCAKVNIRAAAFDRARRAAMMRAMPIRRIATACLIAAAATLLAGPGCQQPYQPDSPTFATSPGADFDTLWDAALRVLRQRGFEPDRQDRAEGVIVTTPTTTRQWFEFWRQDAVDAYSVLEASLHTIQRRVTVRIPRDPIGVDVQVEVMRLMTPERQVTTASGGLNLFASAVPTTEGERVVRSADAMGWEPLGRDATMEQVLLDQILRMAVPN